MTEERNTRTYSRDIAGLFHRSSIGGGTGTVEIFFPFIFIVPAIVSNCHLVLSGNTAKRDTEKSKQSLII